MHYLFFHMKETKTKANSLHACTILQHAYSQENWRYPFSQAFCLHFSVDLCWRMVWVDLTDHFTLSQLADRFCILEWHTYQPLMMEFSCLMKNTKLVDLAHVCLISNPNSVLLAAHVCRGSRKMKEIQLLDFGMLCTVTVFAWEMSSGVKSSFVLPFLVMIDLNT